MRTYRLSVLMLFGATLLFLSGCVELTGQRITWFYDAVQDRLEILIHYDGIHDSGSGQHGQGVEQIPEFVKNGDVMFLDWPFRVPMPQLREKSRDEDASPNERELARLITSIQTEPVGYYREPDGRIGAAQRLTIPNATEFVRTLNGLMSEEILDEDIPASFEMARTLERMQAAAKAGHQWITLDGHAIRFNIPVHRGEWARLKAEWLNEIAGDVAEALADNGDEEGPRNVAFALRAFTSVPVSYIDEGDHVEFIVGRRDSPGTLRAQIRDEYEPSLEKVVADAVKTDLDQTLAAALLDGREPSPPVSAALNWGPPEEQVRALVVAAERGDASRRQAALARLESWAKQWNRERGVPKAPDKADDPEGYLAAWKAWYGQMRQYPLLGPEEAQGAKPAEPAN